MGGYDGASRQCLCSVECYNPEMDTWTIVNDMNSRRSGAGMYLFVYIDPSDNKCPLYNNSNIINTANKTKYI